MKSIQNRNGGSDEDDIPVQDIMSEHQMSLEVDELIQTEITETLAQFHLQEKVIDAAGPVPPLIFKYILIAIGLCGVLIGIVLGAIIGQRLLAASAVEDMPYQHYAPSIAPLDSFQPHTDATHDPTLEPTLVDTNVSTYSTAHPTRVTSYPPTLSSSEYTESRLAPTANPM
jgi:hypothetical protein